MEIRGQWVYNPFISREQRDHEQNINNGNLRLIEILDLQENNKQQLEVQVKDTFENMLTRLCLARDHIFWKDICNKISGGCGHDFQLDEDGKSIIKTDYCNNPFCDSKNCFRYRVSMFKLILQSYFYAFPTWKGRNQKWLHFILGQKRIKKINEDSLKDLRKDVIKFLKYMKENYKNPHMIAVFDIAYDGKTFYLHYHVAMRLRGYMDEKKLNEISLKNNLKYKRADGDYARKPKSIINYFAQRLAGSFGHKRDETQFMYYDLFTPEEYFNYFYRKKKFLTRGFDGKQIKEVLKKIKEDSFRLEESVSPNNTNNRMRKSCQNCGHWDKVREYVEDPNKLKDKPPDPSSGLKIEVVYLGGGV